MASSTQNHHHQHFPNTTTSAPPPTPSTTHPNPSTSSAATDLLSRLLHRLPPTLSTTPLRRRPSLTPNTISPPIIPYTDLNSTISTTLHSISELGYFQLTDHPIPPHLAHTAQTDSLSIFKLPRQEKKQHFSKNWPIGFNNSNEDEDHDDDDDDSTESLFLDSDSLFESNDEFSLSSLHGFMHAMEKVGLSVVEGLTCAMGLVKNGTDGVCSLLWLGDTEGGDQVLGSGSGKFYPYVVGLHYMFSSGRCGLMTDSGLISVKTEVDSILVTVGDIAQGSRCFLRPNCEIHVLLMACYGFVAYTCLHIHLPSPGLLSTYVCDLTASLSSYPKTEIKNEEVARTNHLNIFMETRCHDHKSI